MLVTVEITPVRAEKATSDVWLTALYDGKAVPSLPLPDDDWGASPEGRPPHSSVASPFLAKPAQPRGPIPGWCRRRAEGSG
jgi:hypothetical protein